MRPALTEKEFTGQVVELARTLAWKRYHTWKSKHSAAGWPDEALVRDRLVIAELKRRGGKPSPDQVLWLDALASAGVEVYLWTEDDFDEIGRVLSTRSILQRLPGSHELYSPATDEWWRPASLWIPGVGRADTQALDRKEAAA